MIYVLKTKFEWAQHTQKNTKTKTTTVRTQNNAASAFISLNHYMCSDKTSFFLLTFGPSKHNKFKNYLVGAGDAGSHL